MNNSTVAARYARALFTLTERRKETVAALESLLGMGELLARGSRLARFFASPEVRLPDKRELLGRALEKRTAHSIAAFMDLLLRKKRLHDLPAIVTAYQALVESSQGIKRAHLVSAVPFSKAELARLQKQLEAHTHAKIKLTTEVDVKLLGGAQVRIGDRVIDRSVHTLLGTIAARLHGTSV